MPEKDLPFPEDHSYDKAWEENIGAWEMEQKHPREPKLQQDHELVDTTRLLIETIAKQENELIEKLMTPESYQLYLQYYHQCLAQEDDGHDSVYIESPLDSRGRNVESLYNQAVTIARSPYHSLGEKDPDRRSFEIDYNSRLPVKHEGRWQMDDNLRGFKTSRYLSDGGHRDTRYGRHVSIDGKGRLIEETYRDSYYHNPKDKVLPDNNEIKMINHQLGQIAQSQQDLLNDSNLANRMTDSER